MEKEIYYDVHSDCNENNIFESFMGRGAKQKAIAYAKRNKDEMTYVDRAVHYIDCDEWEYECVWSYSWEE